MVLSKSRRATPVACIIMVTIADGTCVIILSSATVGRIIKPQCHDSNHMSTTDASDPPFPPSNTDPLHPTVTTNSEEAHEARGISPPPHSLSEAATLLTITERVALKENSRIHMVHICECAVFCLNKTMEIYPSCICKVNLTSRFGLVRSARLIMD